MTELTLKRNTSTPTGTFGEIVDADNIHICYSLERPWLNNDIQTSCIPTGQYNCTMYASPTKGAVYLLEGTEPRHFIEIHAANVYTELEGCIAPGEAFGLFQVDGNDELEKHSGLTPTHVIRGITDSVTALTLLKTKVNFPEDFTLNII